ncbi:MAG TPA: hypothetical protein VG123_13770 [Streptosporangiaceae bacterium]|nr:hypothetical protein [Streptosporangiaceae bacterium]
MISSDFYSVYTSAGKKTGGLVNLYCWAQYAEPGIMRNGAAGWPGLLAVAGLVQLPGAGSSA